MRHANVAELERDTNSILTFYRDLIALRRRDAVLRAGTLEDITVTGSVLRYARRFQERALDVLLNLGPAEQSIEGCVGTILLSTVPERALGPVPKAFILLANEGVVIERSSPR